MKRTPDWRCMEPMDRPDARQNLRTAAAIFLPLFLFHQGDHIRRGFGMATNYLIVLGTLGGYLAVLTLTLIWTNHRFAPQIAVFTGLSTAAGFAAVHWLPTWSAFSDSFISHHVDWISWTASVGEVAGALFLAIAGVRAFRNEQSVGA